MFGIDQIGDTVDHFANCLDLLCVFVFDLDVELAFQVEEDVDAVHRIDAQLLEGAVGPDLFDGNSLGGRNHSKNSCLDRLRHRAFVETAVLTQGLLLQGGYGTVSVKLNREPGADNSLSLKVIF